MNTLYRLKKIVISHSNLLLIGIFLAGVCTAIIILKIAQGH